MKKKKRLSGHASLKAAGRHPIQIGIPDVDYPAAALAAKIEGRSLSNFVVHHVTVAAKSILKNQSLSKEEI